MTKSGMSDLLTSSQAGTLDALCGQNKRTFMANSKGNFQ